MNSIDRFLDQACLAYDGNDTRGRRDAAREILLGEPSIVSRSIHVAAAVGDAQTVRTLLADEPASVTGAAGPRAWNSILYLCYSRVQIEQPDVPAALVALLDAGADPRSSFALGSCTFTALAGVIGDGEGGLKRLPPHSDARTLARRLLDAGAPANDPQAIYNTMLSPGDEWLELLVDRGLSANDEINWDMGVSPTPRTVDFVLCGAAKDGRVARVALMLSCGANPNSASPYDGRSALVGARIARQNEIAEILIAHGARMPILEPNDRLRLALADGDREAARAVVEQDPSVVNDTGLVADLASRKFIDALQMVFDLGADPDTLDRNGSTALHQAAHAGSLDVIAALLRAGADTTLRDRHHDGTPSDWARHAQREDVVLRLDAHVGSG